MRKPLHESTDIYPESDVFLGSHNGKDYWLDRDTLDYSEPYPLIIIVSENLKIRLEYLNANDFTLPDSCIAQYMILKLKGEQG